MKQTFLCFFIFITNTLFAQQAKIAGQVIDANSSQGIEFATITFKSVNSSDKIVGAKSKENGLFTIDKLDYGTYEVTISSIGYNSNVLKQFAVNKAVIDLKKITLSINAKSVKEATIIGEKADVEIGIDKKTFNVDKNITSAGGTASDILKNIPSVNVDMDGNVSIRGKDNVTLLVDGKPSAMFGTDPQTALQSIPASSIESIEVITNPSSKYDAQGMSGILNIILKKDRKAGYNGMLTLGAGSPYRLNGGINFNANVKKWNFFVNANGRTSKTWEETTADRDNYDNKLTYSSFTHNDRKPLNGFINIGGDYTIDKNNKISLSENIFNAKMKGISTNTIENQVNYSDLLSKQVRENSYVGNPLSSTTNLQYKHNFKKPKEELNIEVNFSKMRYLRESNFTNYAFDSNNVFLSSYKQHNPIVGGNWNGTFQVDYTKPILKNGRIDVGEKSYFIKFKSENQPTIQYTNQAEVAEPFLKNHFVFNQQIHSVYANLANQYKSTGVQIGLRAEYFAYDGIVYQYNSTAKDHYTSLFPTLFVTQKISKKEDLNFNYSRRVNRPDFRQLVPYLDVSNPQDTSQGNPNLKPEFIHATELTYNNQYGKGNNFIASAYFQYTTNLIQRYRRYNSDGTTYSQNRNLASGYTYGVEIINKFNIYSWWDATMNVNLFKNNLNGSNIDPTLSRSGYGGFAKLISNTKFNKTMSAQFTANYNAQTVIAQGTVEPYGNIDVAIKKSFMKNLITLTLNANDILNTIKTTTNYNFYPYYNQTVVRKNQTRSIGLNLQIKFASKSMRNNPDAFKKTQTKKEKEKEAKSRDENLKKDEGGGEDNNGGGNKEGNK